jgi:type IV secretory pathway VirB10-like protein
VPCSSQVCSIERTSQCLFKDTAGWAQLVRCRQVGFMKNDHIPPEQQPQQTEQVPTKADDGREAAEQDRGLAEERSLSAEAVRNEAEQHRRLAEEAREGRDQQREALETSRQERERLREAAETARAASEEARAAAEAARHAVVDAMRATAETLSTALEHMKVVEDMRRTLREIKRREHTHLQLERPVSGSRRRSAWWERCRQTKEIAARSLPWSSSPSECFRGMQRDDEMTRKE